MDYQICTKTVMDTSDSGITFNKDGVCDHVDDFENHVKPNWNTGELGKAELENMFSKIKSDGKDKDFDLSSEYDIGHTVFKKGSFKVLINFTY